MYDALENNFPAVAFKISSRVSGDNYLYKITYTDGIAPFRVKGVAGRFERPPSYNRKGVKVEIDRSMSDSVKRRIVEETKCIFSLESVPPMAYIPEIGMTACLYISKVFNMRDFS